MISFLSSFNYYSVQIQCNLKAGEIFIQNRARVQIKNLMNKKVGRIDTFQGLQIIQYRLYRARVKGLNCHSPLGQSTSFRPRCYICVTTTKTNSSSISSLMCYASNELFFCLADSVMQKFFMKWVTSYIYCQIACICKIAYVIAATRRQEVRP